MTFEIISEGSVCQRDSAGPDPVAVGPRCAVTDDGQILCSYMIQSKLGLNDFKPILSRSTDNGRTWTEQGPIWPELTAKYSIFCSLSRSLAGELFLFGTRTRIDQTGESNWCEETQGLKQNELIWARSTDAGRTWSEPTVIPMPIPGSAECPGTMCVTRKGRWLCCYGPYNNFDRQLRVDRNQLVVLSSSDQGRTWTHQSMMRFQQNDSGAAEAWVVELTDARLLGTCWHVSYAEGVEYPNAYTLSLDDGHTWTTAKSTGITGQSTALASLPDGRALFIYNQRTHGDPGVYLSVVSPTPENFGIQVNQPVRLAQKATQSDSTGQHQGWTDFSFGEPSVTVLPDGTLLVALWCVQPASRGIRYVKLELCD